MKFHILKYDGKVKSSSLAYEYNLHETLDKPPHSGLRRPKNWPKVEKDSDMIEILYTRVFGVAEFENEGKSKK